MPATATRRDARKQSRTAPYGRLFIVGTVSGVNLNHISNESHRVQKTVADTKLRPGESIVFFNRDRTHCRIVTVLETAPPMPIVQLVPYERTNVYRNHAEVLESLVQCTDVRNRRDEMEILKYMAKCARDARAFAEALDAARKQTIRLIKRG
jgi:hypothetical protein